MSKKSNASVKTPVAEAIESVAPIAGSPLDQAINDVGDESVFDFKEVDGDSAMSYQDMIRSVMSMLGYEVPSNVQLLASFVSGLAIAGLGGYVGGQLATLAYLAITAYTGFALLGAFIGIIIAILGIYLATRAATAVAGYVASSSVRKDYAAVKNFVSGLFGKNIKGETA